MSNTNKFRIVFDRAECLYFIEEKRRFWFGWERVTHLPLVSGCGLYPEDGMTSLGVAEACLTELVDGLRAEADKRAIKRSKNRIEVIKTY